MLAGNIKLLREVFFQNSASLAFYRVDLLRRQVKSKSGNAPTDRLAKFSEKSNSKGFKH